MPERSPSFDRTSLPATSRTEAGRGAGSYRTHPRRRGDLLAHVIVLALAVFLGLLAFALAACSFRLLRVGHGPSRLVRVRQQRRRDAGSPRVLGALRLGAAIAKVPSGAAARRPATAASPRVAAALRRS